MAALFGRVGTMRNDEHAMQYKLLVAQASVTTLACCEWLR